MCTQRPTHIKRKGHSAGAGNPESERYGGKVALAPWRRRAVLPHASCLILIGFGPLLFVSLVTIPCLSPHSSPDNSLIHCPVYGLFMPRSLRR